MSRKPNARTPTERGRANREKGMRAERDVARFLRVNGWPDAERRRDSGFRSSDRASADQGDVRGTPRLVWQVKTGPLSTTEIRRALSDTEDQTVAAGADYGLLVCKVDNKGDPGVWGVWLSLRDLYSLLTHQTTTTAADDHLDAPVRLSLIDTLSVLHNAGYGVREVAA